MISNKNIFILLIVCTFAFIVNLGVFEPDLMEARNFVTAREILQNDQWLIPTMNGTLRLEKPPFPTWFSAINMHFFGPSLFSMRLPAALMACLLIFFFYRLNLVLFKSQEAALIGSVVLATSPTMIEMGRTGSWDIFCQAMIMGAIYYLVKGLNSTEKHYRYFILGGIFIGLSSMSKGPVAIYGMLLPFLISYFVVYKFSALKGKRSALIVAVLIALLLSTWWYLYVNAEVPQISTKVAQKEMDAWANRHQRPFWFYFHFPVFMGVWSIFVVAAFFYKYFKKKLVDSKKYLFALLWVLTGVLLLSLIPEKKERYLLPIIPPMALLVGMMLTYLKESMDKKEEGKVEKTIYTGFSSILLLLIIALPVALYFLFYLPGYMSLAVWIICALTMVPLLIAGVKFMRKKLLMKQIGLVVVLVGLLVTLVMPAFREYRYNNPDFINIAEIKQKEWYQQYNFYTPDEHFNLKAVWRIGKEVKVVDNEKGNWPEKKFIMISEYSAQKGLGEKLSASAEVTKLGTYHYYRKKSKFRLYVYRVEL